MSQSHTIMGRPRGHSLSAHSATSFSLTPSEGEPEEEDWYESNIDRSLDLARPRRLSTPAATGQWASTSLCAQSADREDDQIDQLLDALDSPHLGEELVVQVAPSESIRPPTRGHVDTPEGQHSDPQVNEVTVSDAKRGSGCPTPPGLTTVPRPLFYTMEWLDQVAAILGCDITNCRETCRLLNRGTVDDWEDCWGGTSLGYQALYTRTLGYLLRQLPSAPPTILSPLVQGLVSWGCLAAFCVTSGLVNRILSTSPEQRRLIQDYKAAVLAATSGDPLETDEFWTEIQAPPFLGYYVAVLLEGMICDADFNFEPARIVFHTRIRPFFEKYCRSVTDGIAPKGALLGENGCNGLEVIGDRDPQTRSQQIGVTVKVHDNLWGQASAPSMVIARHIAIRIALQQLSTLPPLAFCTCSTPTKGEGRLIDEDVQPSGSSGWGEWEPD